MKKKKLIKFGLIGVAFFVIVFLVVQVFSKLSQKADIKEKLSHLPNVELQDMNGNKTKLHELIPNEKIVLAYINTECSICSDQMKAFEDVLPQLTNTKIILVSGQELETLQAYNTQNEFLNHHKIKLAYDYTEHFYIDFDIKATPHILIYDENGELLLNHKGYLKGDKLLEVLE